MKKFTDLLKVGLLSTLLALPTFANAELIKLLDFTETAEEDEGPVPGVFTFEDLLGISGFDVTFTTIGGDFHWLDAGSGLGVCKTDDCNNNSDDNINVGEGITFTFTLDGSPFNVDDMTLLFVGHENEGGIMESIVEKVPGQFVTIDNNSPMFTYLGTTDTYPMSVVSGELYLGSVWISNELLPPQSIPEPGNLLLFLSGLTGILIARRKSQTDIK
ncbi:PEP-CTERM sorting domain-containing protein [Thalassotalea sp. PS06]|uniref:PEP-CTERM sorting domain-containing protein n=1 Tax=Thalassotalea sp. PS06 TaxID=2594005 RepID=UPI001162DC84|nr:PEP-CTERM sorting domain-containing protein [Thalassotalea sp. PS06]QDP01974.1 PEP-CTERM sorting domain-containing protein [Thalassotalea sp. PS06]